MTSAASSLPYELAAELAALPPFTSYQNALDVVNGRFGEQIGIRGRYLSRLHAIARTDNLSDQLVIGVGEAIARQCDHAIALQARIQDSEHGPAPGWTSVPVDSLTQAEKEALT